MASFITSRTALLCAVTAALLVSGCELFVVGGGRRAPQVVERSQRTPIGVVYLFKEELDSNNTMAATELMVHSSGRKLLAVEKFEMKDEMARIQRLIANKPITEWAEDTLSASARDVRITLDHIRKMHFSTMLSGDSWFISRIHDK